MMMYYFLKFLSFISQHISKKQAEKAGYLLGNFLWLFVPPKRKKLSVHNILRTGITNRKTEAQRISKEAAVRFGHIALSMFRFPLLSKENIEDRVTVRGKEILDSIQDTGKGCILAANHCGNWEMEGATLSLLGYPILAVGTQQTNRGFDQFIREYRSMVGQTVEYKTGVRNIYKRLKEGYFVGLLCDQDPGMAGIFSPFFGEETLTPTGPAHLSIMTGLPVVPVFIHTTGNDTYDIVIANPIKAPKNREKKEAVQAITDEINRQLEGWIRQYPEEWFWLHNRWKHTDKCKEKEREEA